MNQSREPHISLDPSVIYLEEQRLEMIEADREQREERVRDNFELDKIHELSKVCQQFWQSRIGEFIMDEASNHAEHAKKQLVLLSRAELGTEKFLVMVEEYQQAAHVPALLWTWINNAILRAKQEGIVHEEEK